MKALHFILFTFFVSFSAFASESTDIHCEMKRDEWDKTSFEFRFLTPKRALTAFHFQKGETSGVRHIPISAIHQSSEARYVGLNFLSDEKLVFIFITPIFAAENLGVLMDIEVVSSIYGPFHVNCRSTNSSTAAQ